jgi:membrane protein DedA with SNARE-associated domain
VSSILDRLLNLPGWIVLLVTGLVVFCEDALFVGFVLPGETVAVLAGVAAKLGHVSLAGVLVVVVLAAIVGDSVGYEIGRHFGSRVLELKVFDKRRERLDDARSFLARRGGSAVFLGRWVAFFRAVMPALTGTARMRYPKFLAYNAAGGIVWGAVVVLVGYAAGASYAQVQHSLGQWSAYLLLGLVAVGLLTWRIRERRRRHQAHRPGQDAPGPAATPG